MNNSRTYTNWGLAVLVILLSPIIVIFTVPLAIGVGFDVLDSCGETPFAIALLAPVAFVLLRRVSPRALVHQFEAAGAVTVPARRAHQVGALACAALFAVLAYAAYRGGLFHGTYAAGDFGLFNAAAMGRLLFGRDALATEAAGALLLLALVTGGARWAGWAVTARRRR